MVNMGNISSWVAEWVIQYGIYAKGQIAFIVVKHSREWDSYNFDVHNEWKRVKLELSVHNFYTEATKPWKSKWKQEMYSGLCGNAFHISQ